MENIELRGIIFDPKVKGTNSPVKLREEAGEKNCGPQSVFL
jgi:hypothetical protein